MLAGRFAGPTGIATAFFTTMALSFTAHGQEGTSGGGKSTPLREVLQFLWTHVVHGEGTIPRAAAEDLGTYLAGNDKLPQLKEIVHNGSLSNRQKASRAWKLCPLAYGSVAMQNGTEHSGIILFSRWSDLRIQPETGGETEIAIPDIQEITAIEYRARRGTVFDWRVAVRTHKGRLIRGTAVSRSVRVKNAASETSIGSREIKRIVLVGKSKIRCPDCFETMEIDWRFCPYCGKKLHAGALTRGKGAARK